MLRFLHCENLPKNVSLVKFGRYGMVEKNLTLSKLWALLRQEEKKFGLDQLSLTERDVFQSILHLLGQNRHISLENILNRCQHPRATFFRSLKKLRSKNIIQVNKDTFDSRKSFISVSKKYQ